MFSLIPRFNGEKYDYWSKNVMVLLKSLEIWNVVEDGYVEPENEGALTQPQRNALRENRKKDSKALFYIYQTIDMSVYERIAQAGTSKEAWDIIHAAYKGKEKVKMVRLQTLRSEFEKLEMKETESIREYFTRVNSVVNKMASNGEILEDARVVEKVLRSLTPKFDYVEAAIEESTDLSTLTLDDLQGRLEAHEFKINKRKHASSQPDQALKSQVISTGGNWNHGHRFPHWNGRDGRARGRGRGFNSRGRGYNFQGIGRGLASNQYEGDKNADITFPNRGRGCGYYHGRGRYEGSYYNKPWLVKRNYWSRQGDDKQVGAGFMHESNIGNYEQDTLLVAACHENCMEEVWYLDSGASKHMTGNKNLFSSLKSIDHGEVTIGDAKAYKIEGVGEISFKSKSGNVEKMSEVYYVPGLKSNLLSAGHLLRRGYDIHFHDNACFLSKKDQLIAKIGVAGNNLFPLKLETTNLSCFVGREKGTSRLWHDRFGHLNYGSLKLLATKNMVEGLPQINEEEGVCEECQFGKQHRNPFPSHSSWQAEFPLDLVHSDLCGPMPVPSLGGRKYFISFIDDFSRKVWVCFLKEKSEAFQAFKKFKAEVENIAGRSIKILRTDRGGEYLSNEFEKYCRDNGIKHQLTARYTPQQNGVSERKNRTIMEMVRCMLKRKKLQKELWAEAVSCAIYLINRSPTKCLKDCTPHEAWSEAKC